MINICECININHDIDGSKTEITWSYNKIIQKTTKYVAMMDNHMWYESTKEDNRTRSYSSEIQRGEICYEEYLTLYACYSKTKILI